MSGHSTTVHRWTPSQQAALDAFDAFLCGSSLRSTFILRGAAGTGKTTLVGELVRRTVAMGSHARLMAPTGRAARVLGERTLGDASTIHAAIFRLETVDELVDQSEQPVFHHGLRKSEDPGNTVFFVDEASVLSDKETMDTNLRFGCDRLLKDLVEYAFLAHPHSARKLVFIGDHCQLPPIGMNQSPALDAEYLSEEHKLVATECTLTDVVRHEEDSALLNATTALRDLIESPMDARHTLEWNGGAGLIIHHGLDSFQRALRNAHSSTNTPHVVCHRNATVAEWNEWTRTQLLHAPVEPRAGDRLTILRNHAASGLSNGDFVTLVDIERRETRRFRDVALHYAQVRVRYDTPDGAHEWSGLMLESALASPERDLTDAEAQARWVMFKMDHPHLRPKTPEFKLALRSDSYWSCLVARYGYATTCHKSQGGEWDEIFVDCDAIDTRGPRSDESLRWLYTAVTRARKTLHLLNPPTWTAAGVLSGARSEAAPESMQTPISIEEQVVMLMTEAAQANGIEGEFTLVLLQYMVRASWRRAAGSLQADVIFKGDGSISRVTWLGGRKGEQLFTQPELESRRYAKLPPPDVSAYPAGVQQTIAHVTAVMKAHGLEIHWTPKQYQLVLTAYDPNSLQLGIARVQAHYNGSGIITARTFLDPTSPLTARMTAALADVR